MDYVWVAIAFVCGYLAKQVNLPPLIGYLAAGFGLHALGFEPGESLEVLSDLGVTLLLFTIGLKLNVKDLFKVEVWAGATGHMTVIFLLTIVNSLLLGYVGLAYFSDLNWMTAGIIGFVVSFSSTVCAVKILEEKGEIKAVHGQVAIGILIIQDIAAVVFVSLAAGKTPSWWVLSLLALPLLKPILTKLLERSGHGELLTLAGFFIAITGGEYFELIGLERHLGALVIAVLLSGHSKVGELAKSLLPFKDLFLIGFFLSIGFTALPTIDMLLVALIMLVALPVKAGMLFVWLAYLKLHSRTSFLAALSLTNYSEFGLIVCSVSVSYGLLEKEWLVIVALAVALSFAFSSIINFHSHNLYSRWGNLIKRFDRAEHVPVDAYYLAEDSKVLVIGMGRVGTGAYDIFQQNIPSGVCGIEVDRDRVESHLVEGRKVIIADAEDPDFWSQVKLDSVRLIMFAMPNYLDSLEIVRQLGHVGYSGKTAGIARFEDEKEKLLASGIDEVFDFFNEVGAGFAEQSLHLTK